MFENQEKMWQLDLGTVEYPVMVAGYGLYVHVVPQEISGYDYDKYYVGITSNEFHKRWNNGGGYNHQPFGGAIKKYGWKNILHYIVQDHDITEIDAKVLEQCMILALQSFRGWKHGYNGTLGGDGDRRSIQSTHVVDITGQIFGRLKVLSFDGISVSQSGRRHQIWKCMCSCSDNNIVKVRYDDLLSGNTTSCGCIQRESRLAHRPNHYEIKNDYTICYMKSNKMFIFDTELYDSISKYTWYLADNIIQSEYYDENGKRAKVSLLKFILGVKNKNASLQVDFINGNKFNYRRNNLKIIFPTGVDHDEYMKYLSMPNCSVCYKTQSQRWIVFFNNRHNSKQFKTFDEAIAFQNSLTEQLQKPKAIARQVISLNSLEIFESAQDAGLMIGIKRSGVQHSCNKVNEYGGKHPITKEKIAWRYYDDYEKYSDEEKQKLKQKYYTGNMLMNLDKEENNES